MKLYLAPGACSQAAHIVLQELGEPFETVRVDLQTHLTEAGEDYTEINPKGYIPALVLPDGEILTENVAILDYLAGRNPALVPDGPHGRSRLVESLAFIATEIHRPFMRHFFSPAAEERAEAAEAISGRLAMLAGRMSDGYLLGPRMSPADAFLFVMVSWARDSALNVPPALENWWNNVGARPSVKKALAAEGFAA